MQAKEIFLQAIDVEDAAEREVFVNEKCGEDSTLKRKVLALLAANEDPESFLDQPAARFDVTATAFGKNNGSGLSDSSHHGRFLPGTKLADRYRIVSMLGRGGMGEVFRADDLRLGQTVALKFLPRELAKDPKRLEYFHQEVKLARQISHPNICRVYDIGEVNGQQFLSMEYIDGEDLKTLLHRIGRLPKDKGIQIARQLCSGLAAAHAKGVLHRDLKPANIMIDGQGQVRITDFGLATVSADGENVIGMSGTPAYMAPEQLLRGQTNARTDIYSLGLILFEVFTGKPAHDASSLPELQRLHEDSSSARNPSDIVDDIDPAVERAISRCLASDPSMRPRTASELAASLPGGDPLAAALAAGETPHPEIVAMSGDSNPLPRKKAITLLALFVVGLLIFMIGRQRIDSINKIESFLSPEVLTYRAQNVLEQLGYESYATSGDFAFGYDSELTQINNREIAERPEHDNWPYLGFWYRETPTEFKADTLGLWINRGGPAEVDFWFPAWSDAGMQGLRLDSAARLLWFQANPPLTLNETQIAEPPAWSEWFSEDLIGFRLSELEPVAPKVVPPVVYDHYQAWQGKWPKTEQPLYAVAASFEGRPVYFEILADPTGRMIEPSLSAVASAGLSISVIIRWLMLLVAGILVARNVYLRRWDRRGAWRLARLDFALYMFSVLITAHHTWSAWEFAVLINCIAGGLFNATWIGVHYVALEPTVRRHWPELLISWSRLFGGRITDPKVGRDLLEGAVVGTASSLCLLLFSFAKGNSYFPYGPYILIGPLRSLGNAILSASEVFHICLPAAFTLVIVSIVLRKKVYALGFGILFYGTTQCLLDGADAYLWPLVFAQVGLVTFVFGKNGLLSAISAVFVYYLALGIFTIDPSRPYFSGCMVNVVILIALAVFSFVSALGGWQKLFRPQRAIWQY